MKVPTTLLPSLGDVTDLDGAAVPGVEPAASDRTRTALPAESSLVKCLRLPRRTADRLFLLFAVSAFALEAVALAATPLPLAPDEAYYWEWSRHLDTAYFDKGPVVPLIIWAGGRLFGPGEFGVRIGSLVCQTLFTIILYLFVRRTYAAGLGLLCAVFVWSTLLFASQGLFMTNDPPLSVLYLLALCGAAEAVRLRRPILWLPTLAVLGLAAASKYTAMALYPSFVLFLALTPRERHHLKHPAFWVGSLGILVVLSPLVVWNSRHGWTHLGYNAGHLIGSRELRFRPGHIAELVLGQWGLLGVLTFPLVCAALFACFRRWRLGDSVAGLYLFSSLPLGAVCLLVSAHRSCYANWPMPVYIGGVLAVAHLTPVGHWRGHWIRRRLGLALGLNCALLVAAHLLLAGFTFGLPRVILPTTRLAGWREAAGQVGAALSELRACRRAAPDGRCDQLPVIAGNYKIGSEFAFYLRGRPRVFVVRSESEPRNQYDLWDGMNQIKGEDVLLVLDTLEPLEQLRTQFERVDSLPGLPWVNLVYNGVVIRPLFLFLGRNFSGGQHYPLREDALASLSLGPRANIALRRRGEDRLRGSPLSPPPRVVGGQVNPQGDQSRRK